VEKNIVYQLFHMPSIEPIRIGRIQISIPWLPIPIRIHYADPTRSASGSGSTTLHEIVLYSALCSEANGQRIKNVEN
jgi:hypothetical protein